MVATERCAAGAVVGRGFRLIEETDRTPVGPRWRARAESGDLVELLLVDPLRDGVSREDAKRVLDAASALQHPQLRPARGASLDPTRAVIAYDPAEGVTLGQWIEHTAPQGVRSLTALRDLLDQVCQAVAVVHRGGALAHGGIAPWSVRIESRGARVIARVEAVGAALLAPSTDIDRLAPELDPRALVVSARADVFALGMLLATLLLGEAALPARVSPRLDAERPELDESVRELLRRCLAADPDARPADAARVRDLLRRAQWTPRDVSAPRRPEARAVEPATFERAPPPVSTSPPPPSTYALPESAPPPPWSETTEPTGVRAPPADAPIAPDPTTVVHAPPPSDEEPRAYAATLRTPRRRRDGDDVTRALVAPPPDLPSEHTRHISAPPPDAPLVAESTPLPTPLPTAGLTDADDDLWGGSRSSFHVIPAGTLPPSWVPEAPSSQAPAPFEAPPPLGPTLVPPSRARMDGASLAVAALVAAVFVVAALIAFTR